MYQHFGARPRYWLARLRVRAMPAFSILHILNSGLVIACIGTLEARPHYCLAQLLVRVMPNLFILYTLSLAHILPCLIIHNLQVC